MEELGTIRRRLLTLEDEAKILVTPEVTPTHVVLAADKAAAAKGEEVGQWDDHRIAIGWMILLSRRGERGHIFSSECHVFSGRTMKRKHD